MSKLDFEETKEFYENCKNLRTTAKHFGVAVSSIQRLFKRNEYEHNPNQPPPTKEEIQKLYDELGSVKKVGEVFGKSEPYIKGLMDRYGIATIPRWNNDTEKIVEAYHRLGTAEAVAKELGIGISAVKAHLKDKAGISIRRGQFNVRKAKELYKSGDHTLDELSELFGVSRPTMTKRLREAGSTITVGGKNAILNGSLTELEKELITAGMLGDGHINKSTGGLTARFSLSSKHKEYLDWYKNQFTSQKGNVQYQWRDDSRFEQRGSRSGNVEFQYSEEVAEIRKRWYGDGAKDIPQDICLTPNIVLHWYLQDGNLYTKGQNRITLSTNSFSISGCEMLCQQLSQFAPKIKMNDDKPTIIITGENIPKFLDYIGWRSPVKCFDYKFLYEHNVPNRGNVSQELSNRIPALSAATNTDWSRFDTAWQGYIKQQREKKTKSIIEDFDIKKLEVIEVTNFDDDNAARQIILENEWLGNIGTRYHIYIAKYEGIPVGALCFGLLQGDPLITMTDDLVSTNNFTGIALTRGATVPHVHPHTASKMISMALDDLSRHHHYNAVVAFSDPEAGELGTIYQACSFDYVGKSGGGRTILYNPETGKVKSSWAREAKKKGYLKRHDYTKVLLECGWKKKKSTHKHKYVKVIGGWREDGTYSKKHKQHLQKLVNRFAQEYPKERGR